MFISGSVLHEEPKKNIERELTDLEDFKPASTIYEPLTQPNTNNVPPETYETLKKPVFDPKTDIPKAIASKNASNNGEPYYVE